MAEFSLLSINLFLIYILVNANASRRNLSTYWDLKLQIIRTF